MISIMTAIKSRYEVKPVIMVDRDRGFPALLTFEVFLRPSVSLSVSADYYKLTSEVDEKINFYSHTEAAERVTFEEIDILRGMLQQLAREVLADFKASRRKKRKTVKAVDALK